MNDAMSRTGDIVMKEAPHLSAKICAKNLRDLRAKSPVHLIFTSSAGPRV